MATEIELKLGLDPAAMPALLRHSAVRSLRRGRTVTAHLVSHYYDTSDFLLASAEVALRVRRVGARWVQTIKGPAGQPAGAGLHARAEHEWPLPSAALDVARLAATPWRKLFASAVSRGGLARRFTTDFERRTIPLRFSDGTLALLCVDRGDIRAMRAGRTRRAAIAEIEIELESGAAANLFDLALQLADDLPLAVIAVSKAARGLALLHGERDLVCLPARAQPVALAADVTTGEALSAQVRECLHQIAANAPGLLTDEDPEWVHQMRIGTRRLRAGMSLVAPLAPSAALDHVRAEAKWLADVLGPARDWDVFVRETLPPLANALARDPVTAAGLRRLRARAESRRRAARAAVRDAVGSPRFQRLLLAGGLLCSAMRFGTARPAAADVQADVLDGRAARFGAALLTRRRRKLERRAALLLRGTADERHAVRIAAKRLRYVAEFFAPLFARKRGRSYLKTLAAVQDVLGRWNDASTALRLADASGTTATDAAGAVRGWVAAQAAALEPDLAKAWRRHARARPFWTRH